MARRNMRQWDEERTEQLGYNELFVLKNIGGKQYFYAWLQEPEVDSCPLCSGNAVKVQDLFSKTYWDIIYENGKPAVIKLEYGFYKFRCLNEACRHIFAKTIHFASRNDKVTYRLENEIAHLVMEKSSYRQISDYLQSAITRQAVGQIFNRWVKKKDELRKIQCPPSCIAIISGETDKDRYTLILNLDEGIKVYDILYGVSSLELVAAIRRIGINHIKIVLSDCDPTIIETITDYLPNAIHIIPIHYWFKLVSKDFAVYSHKLLKWCSVRNKDSLIMVPETELGLRKTNLNQMITARPDIEVPYKNFNALRTLINRRDEMWVFEELEEWIERLNPEFKEELSTTIDRLYLQQNQIEAHVHHREYVPKNLFTLTEQMEQYISKMRTFSAEVLRARVLYSVEADLENWSGIPIENVIQELEILKGDNENEYQ